jgi:hypothetical protein
MYKNVLIKIHILILYPKSRFSVRYLLNYPGAAEEEAERHVDVL